MLKHMRDERGGTLVLYTVAMVGMMGMAALAIDLGMLRKARAEAQRAADASALAGASAFTADLPRDVESTMAVALALKVADTNYMNGIKFDVNSEITVKVIPDSVKVRVKARRAAVPTWFARIFGISALPVGAVAAAEASYASGAACVKPLAIPDWWDDGDNDTNGNNLPDGVEAWRWDAGRDVYHPAHWDSNGDGLANDGAGTGLGSELRNLLAPPGERDWGRQVVLRPPNGGDPMQSCPGSFGTLQGGKCYVPSWWGYWGGSKPTLENMIRTCDGVGETGVPVNYQSGFIAAVNSTVDWVVAQDPAASWSDVTTDSISGKTGTVVGSTLSGHWRSSPRVWTVAMVAPGDMPTGPGGSDPDVIFNNFMSFFVEGCIPSDGNGTFTNCGPPNSPGKVLVGRFVGPAKGTLFGPAPGTMTRILRLVE